jgi:hypothetical protein
MPGWSGENEQEGRIRAVAQAPYAVTFLRLSRDRGVPTGWIVMGAIFADRLIGRRAYSPEQFQRWKPLLSKPILAPIAYEAEEDEGGNLRARLALLIPARWAPRDPWEAEPPVDASMPMWLGKAVWRAGERHRHDDPMREAMCHLMTILGGG